MGADYYGCVLIGVPIEPMIKTIEKKQFDPDTGVPYMKPIEIKVMVFKGTDIEIDEEDLEYKEHDCKEVQQIYCCAPDDAKNNFLGVKVAHGCADGGYYGPASMELPNTASLADTTNKVRWHIEEKYKFKPDVKMYLLQQVSV